MNLTESIRMLVKRIILVALCAAMSSCALLPSFGTTKKAREQVYTINPELAVTPTTREAQCGSVALGDALAAPGFRTSRMSYSTSRYEIDYFAYARWADSFARLLRKPLHSGFVAQGSFSEVLAAPALAPTDYRVEFNDVSIIQRFPSRDSDQSNVELAANV